jgi:hypothetical protein
VHCSWRPAVFRVIELFEPTLILDEQEKYLEPGSDFHALLNEGHRRGGQVVRVLGDSKELQAFNVFALVAYAMNGKIPDDLQQRSIVIRTQRRLANEALSELEYQSPDLDALARMCARWAMDHDVDIEEAEPDMGRFINRIKDNWRLCSRLPTFSGVIGRSARVPPPTLSCPRVRTATTPRFSATFRRYSMSALWIVSPRTISVRRWRQWRSGLG